MVLDVLPGCAQLAVAADAAEDNGFARVPEGELVGLLCASGPGRSSRGRCASRRHRQELDRRGRGPERDAEFTADEIAESPARRVPGPAPDELTA